MPNNKYCKIEDFILNDSFVEWVLDACKTPNVFWDSYLNKHPECSEEFNQAKQIILSLKIRPVKDLTDTQVDQLIANVRSRFADKSMISEKPVYKKLVWQTLVRYAAILAVVFSTGWFGYHLFSNKRDLVTQNAGPQTYYQVTNSSQVAVLIKLPDSSSVVLKPNARIKYLKTFAGNRREVFLNGEAFFEVSKNYRKPFFVYANELQVRVIGTSFTIKEYTNESKYKIIVSTGRVEVSARSDNPAIKAKQPIVLLPNQEGTLYSKGLQLRKAILKEPLLLSQESTKKHFNFVAAPFSKVIAVIKEAYGVSIVYNEKAMGNCQLTASLIDQPLDERLKLICQAIEATYKYENGQIIIDGNGCNATNTTL
jgi:ferric-dicitrate binding protein FerR (iron transport regulator)